MKQEFSRERKNVVIISGDIKINNEVWHNLTIYPFDFNETFIKLITKPTNMQIYTDLKFREVPSTILVSLITYNFIISNQL